MNIRVGGKFMHAFFIYPFPKLLIFPFLFSLFCAPLIGQEDKEEFKVQQQDRDLLSTFSNAKTNACTDCRPKRGPTGPTGPTGLTGPTGPTGAIGQSLTTFISLYALNTQIVNSGDPILFDALSAQNGPVIWPGANNGEIVIGKAGTYKISFGLQLPFGGRISLRVNNVDVPGGTLSADLALILPGLIIDVQIPTDGATISLVNTGPDPVTLLSSGPDPSATIAFIEIHQIL